jgi:hypothetical protein
MHVHAQCSHALGLHNYSMWIRCPCEQCVGFALVCNLLWAITVLRLSIAQLEYACKPCALPCAHLTLSNDESILILSPCGMLDGKVEQRNQGNVNPGARYKTGSPAHNPIDKRARAHTVCEKQTLTLKPLPRCDIRATSGLKRCARVHEHLPAATRRASTRPCQVCFLAARMISTDALVVLPRPRQLFSAATWSLPPQAEAIPVASNKHCNDEGVCAAAGGPGLRCLGKLV